MLQIRCVFSRNIPAVPRSADRDHGRLDLLFAQPVFEGGDPIENVVGVEERGLFLILVVSGRMQIIEKPAVPGKRTHAAPKKAETVIGIIPEGRIFLARDFNVEGFGGRIVAEKVVQIDVQNHGCRNRRKPRRSDGSFCGQRVKSKRPFPVGVQEAGLKSGLGLHKALSVALDRGQVQRLGLGGRAVMSFQPDDIIPEADIRSRQNEIAYSQDIQNELLKSLMLTT